MDLHTDARRTLSLLKCPIYPYEFFLSLRHTEFGNAFPATTLAYFSSFYYTEARLKAFFFFFDSSDMLY